MSYSRKVSHQAKQVLLLGSTCCNCGKECGNAIEYHHVVPLERGGKDTIENLKPLCYECHSIVHFDCARRKPERTGRRRREYDNALLDSVFSRYVDKQIMEKEAREELGTGCRIKDMPQFKEWAEKNGVDPDGRYGRAGRWYK